MVDSIRGSLCLFKCHLILVPGRSAFQRAARFILTQGKQHTKSCKICREAQGSISMHFADALFGGRHCVSMVRKSLDEFESLFRIPCCLS